MLLTQLRQLLRNIRNQQLLVLYTHTDHGPNLWIFFVFIIFLFLILYLLILICFYDTIKKSTEMSFLIWWLKYIFMKTRKVQLVGPWSWESICKVGRWIPTMSWPLLVQNKSSKCRIIYMFVFTINYITFWLFQLIPPGAVFEELGVNYLSTDQTEIETIIIDYLTNLTIINRAPKGCPYLLPLRSEINQQLMIQTSTKNVHGFRQSNFC